MTTIKEFKKFIKKKYKEKYLKKIRKFNEKNSSFNFYKNIKKEVSLEVIEVDTHVDSWIEANIKHPLINTTLLISLFQKINDLPFVEYVFISQNYLIRVQLKDIDSTISIHIKENEYLSIWIKENSILYKDYYLKNKEQLNNIDNIEISEENEEQQQIIQFTDYLIIFLKNEIANIFNTVLNNNFMESEKRVRLFPKSLSIKDLNIEYEEE